MYILHHDLEVNLGNSRDVYSSPGQFTEINGCLIYGYHVDQNSRHPEMLKWKATLIFSWAPQTPTVLLG